MVSVGLGEQSLRKKGKSNFDGRKLKIDNQEQNVGP